MCGCGGVRGASQSAPRNSRRFRGRSGAALVVRGSLRTPRVRTRIRSLVPVANLHLLDSLHQLGLLLRGHPHALGSAHGEGREDTLTRRGLLAIDLIFRVESEKDTGAERRRGISLAGMRACMAGSSWDACAGFGLGIWGPLLERSTSRAGIAKCRRKRVKQRVSCLVSCTCYAEMRSTDHAWRGTYAQQQPGVDGGRHHLDVMLRTSMTGPAVYGLGTP